jgi:hypothetical protein
MQPNSRIRCYEIPMPMSQEIRLLGNGTEGLRETWMVAAKEALGAYHSWTRSLQIVVALLVWRIGRIYLMFAIDLD